MYFRTPSAFAVIIIFVLTNFIQTYQAEVLPDHVKSQLKKLNNRCIKQSGVDEAIIAQADAMPENQNFKCFLHCLYNTVGLIDSNNVIHLEYLLEMVPEHVHDKLNNLVNTCGSKDGEDACDTAYQTTSCYIKTDPVLVKSVFSILGS